MSAISRKIAKVSEIFEHHCGYALHCHTNASPCFENYSRVVKETTQKKEVREHIHIPCVTLERLKELIVHANFLTSYNS